MLCIYTRYTRWNYIFAPVSWTNLGWLSGGPALGLLVISSVTGMAVPVGGSAEPPRTLTTTRVKPRFPGSGLCKPIPVMAPEVVGGYAVRIYSSSLHFKDPQWLLAHGRDPAIRGPNQLRSPGWSPECRCLPKVDWPIMAWYPRSPWPLADRWPPETLWGPGDNVASGGAPRPFGGWLPSGGSSCLRKPISLWGLNSPGRLKWLGRFSKVGVASKQRLPDGG